MLRDVSIFFLRGRQFCVVGETYTRRPIDRLCKSSHSSHTALTLFYPW